MISTEFVEKVMFRIKQMISETICIQGRGKSQHQIKLEIDQTITRRI